jgi:hypothetical protein
VFCRLPAGRLSNLHFSGEEIVSLAQISFCSNHDFPPSIDVCHMRRSADEYKDDSPLPEKRVHHRFFCAPLRVPMPR